MEVGFRRIAHPEVFQGSPSELATASVQQVSDSAEDVNDENDADDTTDANDTYEANDGDSTKGSRVSWSVDVQVRVMAFILTSLRDPDHSQLQPRHFSNGRKTLETGGCVIVMDWLLQDDNPARLLEPMRNKWKAAVRYSKACTLASHPGRSVCEVEAPKRSHLYGTA